MAFPYLPNVTLMPAYRVNCGRPSPLRSTVHCGSTKALRMLLPDFPGLAHTEADGDVVGVVFQVERPGAGGAQIPAFFQVMDDEGLHRGAFDMRAVVVAGERTLVLHQCAEQTARRGSMATAARPPCHLPVPSSSCSAVGAVISGPMPNCTPSVFSNEDIEQVQIADAGAVTVVRIGAGADRQRGAHQLRHADEIVRRDRQGAAQQHVIGVRVAVVEFGGVVVLQVGARRDVQRVVAFVGVLGVIRLRATAAASELARKRVFPTRLNIIPDSLVAYGQLGTCRPLRRNPFLIKPVGHV